MSETEIIKKLQQRDEKAFKEMVEKYQKLVVNTCFRMVHNQEDAEDIAQEVFIEVYRSVHKFRLDSKLSTWLYRISVNRSLNFIRDNKCHKGFQTFGDSEKNENAVHNNLINKGTDNPEFELENSERAKMLQMAIDSLAENQKVAFTLNKYEDLSYQQIAEVMETSLSSIESLIHRAKKNLQKKLYTCYKKKCI